MAEQKKPVQHTPVHLRGEVFDPKHPAASAFAPAQPGAGVVADDVEELGQNLNGGETAEQAAETWKDQKEVLAEAHNDRLQAQAPTTETADVVVGQKAVAADSPEGKKATAGANDPKPASSK